MSEALLRAAEQGRSEFVRRLLNHGENVNAADEEGNTTLMSAAANGHVDVMRLLIERGASVGAQDNNGITALAVAAYGGYSDALQLLIDQGAGVNGTDDEGATALHRAAYGRNRGKKYPWDNLPGTTKRTAIRMRFASCWTAGRTLIVRTKLVGAC